MIMKRSACLALLLVACQSVHAQLVCDETFVSLDQKGSTILVEPSGADDTDNVQCALDEATAAGFPLVKLRPGTFSIGQIETLDFVGSLEGTSRTSTEIVPLANAVNCAGQNFYGPNSAMFTFVGGAVQLRTMKIDASMVGALCQEEGQPARQLVLFTGITSGDCGFDVIQSAVDRVDFIDDYENQPSFEIAIAAKPAQAAGACYGALLGGLKINRNTFAGVGVALETRMASVAQVDINFNTFTSLVENILIVDANQSTTVLKNEFNLGRFVEREAPKAVWVYSTSPNRPDENRLSFEGNTVNMSTHDDDDAFSGIWLQNSPFPTALNASIRDNLFRFIGPLTASSFNNRRALDIQDVNNATVAGNRFVGEGTGLFITAYEGSTSGNAVTGNTFDLMVGETVPIGVFLSNSSTQNTVGPGQGAYIVDTGEDNFVSDDGNSSF